MHKNITYKRFGEKAILVEWESKIDETILDDIVSFTKKIASNNYVELAEMIQGYNSITILYKKRVLDFEKEVHLLKSIYTSAKKIVQQDVFQWEIPVCYDVKFGIDLNEISSKKNKTIAEIIELHSAAVYKIYFIGFLPGFLYLGGLNESLFMDRKSNPRINVAKGSVGIGGKQTGVYPNNSAGGWNIIGKTPINFFDVEQSNPCFAKAGDCIKFTPISLDEFYQLKDQIRENTFQLSKTLYHA